MIRISIASAAVIIAVAAAACARQDATTESVVVAPAHDEAPQGEFYSEAQKNRARYYWSEELLEPYGVAPADSRTMRLAGT